MALGRMALSSGRAGKVPPGGRLHPRAPRTACPSCRTGAKAVRAWRRARRPKPRGGAFGVGLPSVWGREVNQPKSPSADLGIGDAMARDDREQKIQETYWLRVRSRFQGSSPLLDPSPSLPSPRIMEGSEAQVPLSHNKEILRSCP